MKVSSDKGRLTLQEKQKNQDETDKVTKRKQRANTDRGRQALLTKESRGAQVRSVKDRTHNETQLKITRQQKMP